MLQKVRELKQFVSAAVRRKGATIVYSAAPQINLNVSFLALWLLARLRSRPWACRCRCYPRLLSFRNGLGGHVGLAAVFRFGSSGNFFVVRWLVLHQRTLTLAHKRKLRMFLVPVDANQIAQMHLLRSQQVGQRINHMALNRSLQVPRAVALIRAFF